MSDKMRWRYGETNPVVAAVDAATEIEIGDLLWHDTDDAKPASDVPDQGSVATTGVFELGCQATAFELGDLVAAAQGTVDVLEDQQVAKASDPALSIGRAARREPNAATAVLVDIRSTVMTGGVKGTTA